jgi:hypothetical protein
VDLIRRAIDLKVELFKIMEEEELHWFKRSHETWLLKGDNNIEFFYRITNGKKKIDPIFLDGWGSPYNGD